MRKCVILFIATLWWPTTSNPAEIVIKLIESDDICGDKRCITLKSAVVNLPYAKYASISKSQIAEYNTLKDQSTFQVYTTSEVTAFVDALKQRDNQLSLKMSKLRHSNYTNIKNLRSDITHAIDSIPTEVISAEISTAIEEKMMIYIDTQLIEIRNQLKAEILQELSQR